MVVLSIRTKFLPPPRSPGTLIYDASLKTQGKWSAFYTDLESNWLPPPVINLYKSQSRTQNGLLPPYLAWSCSILLRSKEFTRSCRRWIIFHPTSPSSSTAYLFVICLDYVLRTSVDIIKDNGFTVNPRRSPVTCGVIGVPCVWRPH